MRFIDTLKTAIWGLKANKVRTFLTMLGILIGITAIMLISSLGGNTEKVIVGELGGLGAETIVIRPGKEPSGPNDFAEVLLSDSLKEREFEEILKKSKVPGIVSATPEVFLSASASYGSETFKPTILGISAEFMSESLNLTIKKGRLYDDREIRSKAAVAVIGSRVEEELFGDQDGLGKNIQIKGKKFRVIGVYEPKGQVVFFNVDELLIIPYTTAQLYLTGDKHYTQIIAKAASADIIDRVVFDVEQTLRELHNISDPSKDDFHVQTQQGVVDQVKKILGAFTAFLSMVVAVALVVGGIGIMNVMLVSVTERTKEIGLRKAVGATKTDILLQFLIEAVLLTSIGGIVGVVLGALLSFGASFAVARFLGTGASFSFPFFAAFLGIGSSIVVGLIFGIYPARKAASKSPIEALRYE